MRRSTSDLMMTSGHGADVSPPLAIPSLRDSRVSGPADLRLDLLVVVALLSLDNARRPFTPVSGGIRSTSGMRYVMLLQRCWLLRRAGLGGGAGEVGVEGHLQEAHKDLVCERVEHELEPHREAGIEGG